MTTEQKAGSDPEIEAISSTCKALEGLDSEARARVLRYVAAKLKVDVAAIIDVDQGISQSSSENPVTQRTNDRAEDNVIDDELEGISPIAKKWMIRNGLTAQGLSAIFSLGVDEIDLVANKVPGHGKRSRMHSVLLLKGLAAYIGTGVARFTHEQFKEACLHYEAYDADNFASYMKAFSGEVSGDKRSGYSLSARGLNNATVLVKSLIHPAKH
jgi:hypothetical protein